MRLKFIFDQDLECVEVNCYKDHTEVKEIGICLSKLASTCMYVCIIYSLTDTCLALYRNGHAGIAGKLNFPDHYKLHIIHGQLMNILNWKLDMPV
jgi:hypothetical protein